MNNNADLVVKLTREREELAALSRELITKNNQREDEVINLTARVERVRAYIETVGPIYDTTVFDRIVANDPQAH